jgi:hypothetical protein
MSRLMPRLGFPPRFQPILQPALQPALQPVSPIRSTSRRVTSLLGSTLFGAVVLVGVGCQPSNNVASGPPELLSFTATGPDGTALAFTGVMAAAPVPPLAHFQALFDRLLDPTSLEALDGDGGIQAQQGVVLVTSTPPVDPLTLNVSYTPNGVVPPNDPDSGAPIFVTALPPGPSIQVIPTAALPCATMVSVALNPAKIRSHDQTAAFVLKDATVTSVLNFVTQPFTATITVPTPPAVDGGTDDASVDDGGSPSGSGVPNDSVANVTLNTLVPGDVAAHIAVTVTVGGAVLPGFGPAVADAMNANQWDVAPPPGTTWPPGATVTVTVDADLADGYGSTLGAAVSAAFEVAP